MNNKDRKPAKSIRMSDTTAKLLAMVAQLENKTAAEVINGFLQSYVEREYPELLSMLSRLKKEEKGE